MLHIVTVHWRCDKWIDIQSKYLKHFIRERTFRYAFLNDIPERHHAKFDYVSTEPIQSHPIKLNILADMAAFNAGSPDEYLMFVDGDAFPVGDICSVAENVLRDYPLLAVQRRENNGDVQPHPCLCITTVGFWKSISGDWKKGFRWTNAGEGSTTDVGANLLHILNRDNIDWYPLLRSNKKDIHPVCFGVYGDVVYHHGLGFREGITRADRPQAMKGKNNLLYFIGMMLHKTSPAWFNHPRKRVKRNAAKEMRELSDRVYDWIQRDFHFYRYFVEGE